MRGLGCMLCNSQRINKRLRKEKLASRKLQAGWSYSVPQLTPSRASAPKRESSEHVVLATSGVRKGGQEQREIRNIPCALIMFLWCSGKQSRDSISSTLLLHKGPGSLLFPLPLSQQQTLCKRSLLFTSRSQQG